MDPDLWSPFIADAIFNALQARGADPVSLTFDEAVDVVAGVSDDIERLGVAVTALHQAKAAAR